MDYPSISLQIPNYLLQSPCQQPGHEELTFIMICLNDQCKKRGQVICPECQLDEHSHQASESFITLQKLKKFIEENQNHKSKIFKNSEDLLDTFMKLKKQLLLKLDETENLLNSRLKGLISALEFSNVSYLDIKTNNMDKILKNVQEFSKFLYIDDKQLCFSDQQVNFQKFHDLFDKNFREMDSFIQNIEKEVDKNFETISKQKSIMQLNQKSQFTASQKKEEVDLDKIDCSILQIYESSLDLVGKQKNLKISESRFEISSTGSWYYDGNKKCDAIVLELKKKQNILLWGIKCNKIKDWENQIQLMFEIHICQGTSLKEKQIYAQNMSLNKSEYKLDSSGEFYDLIFEQPIKVELNKKYTVGLLYDQPFETTQGKNPRNNDLFTYSECTDYPSDYDDNGTCIPYGQFPKFIYQIIEQNQK